jgi:phasin family protein
MQKVSPEPVTLFSFPNASYFLEAQTRALDSSVQVSKVLTDTARTLVQRQFDLLRFSLHEGVEYTKSLLSNETEPTIATRHLDYLRVVTARANTEAKELTEIAVKGTGALFDVLNSQAQKDTSKSVGKSLAKTST